MANPRKPTKLKMIQGTFRKDRANPDEPQYEVSIPSPPEHLNKVALVEWGRVSHILFQQGLLTQIDRAALAEYCQAYSRWVDAELKLSETGLVIETTNGNMIKNPLVGIANQAMELMRKRETEFGMTPASRAKVSAKKEDKKADPWDKFG